MKNADQIHLRGIARGRGGTMRPVSTRSVALVTTMLATAIAVALLTPLHAQETTESTEGGLILPDDLTLNSESEDLTVIADGDYRREELRVGNRLDRVTVTWENGITEVYQNRRRDTLWTGEDNELGDVQNVRQWRLGGW